MKTLILSLVVMLCGSAFAFKWQPNQIPPGNHSYTLEMLSTQEGADTQPVTVRIDFVEEGGSYTVNTTYHLSQKGVRPEALGDAMFGGSMLGAFAFGPMLMYGPAYMLLPMMLGEEDIRVRSEPMLVMGLGKLHMDKTEQVAGHECVVLRFESSDGTSEPVEFALAEGLPFPCFSRYSNGNGSFTEVRLVSAE